MWRRNKRYRGPSHRFISVDCLILIFQVAFFAFLSDIINYLLRFNLFLMQNIRWVAQCKKHLNANWKYLNNLKQELGNLEQFYEAIRTLKFKVNARHCYFPTWTIASQKLKLSRRALFDCEKCIPNKTHPFLTPPTHPTTTHEFIGAYFIQILPLGDPAFPRMIQMWF